MTHKVIIFGSNGQMGHALRAAVWPTGWETFFATRDDCDITDPAALRATMQNYRPDLLINAAAMANVDACEKDETEAHKVNFHAVAGMAAQCSALDIPMIHLSTDYVFDGNHNVPYKEDDQMNPINYYGASKMMGEEALRHELPWHVNLRISSVFSQYRANILTKAVEFIDNHDELKFVTDILSAPTPAQDVAETAIKIGQEIANGKVDGYGTFHYCGEPSCSRYDFTRKVMEAYKPYTDRRPTINEATTDDFKMLAARPAFSLLDCSKIERIYGIKQPNWHARLDDAVKAICEMRKS